MSFNFKILLANEPPSPYANEELSLYEVEKLYHTRVNDLFNSKIKLLLEGGDGQGVNEIPEGDDCEENNYTTYCLAVGAAKEYSQYKDELLKRKTQIPLQPKNEPVTLEEASQKATAQASEIQNEINRAKAALDVSLETYDELSKAYAMHLEYKKMIENLTKYTKKLAELRKQIEKLPGKFIDATTPECT
jgi:hypothetical protein